MGQAAEDRGGGRIRDVRAEGRGRHARALVCKGAWPSAEVTTEGFGAGLESGQMCAVVNKLWPMLEGRVGGAAHTRKSR